MRKRFLSLTLVLLMVLGVMPMEAMAQSSKVKVNVYTTVSDLHLDDSSGHEQTTDVKEDGDYKVYTFETEPGNCEFFSEEYGGGKFKVDKAEDIYLRVLDFTFISADSTFMMLVENAEDPDLVCFSNSSSGNETGLKMLAPAKSWDTLYRYKFNPDDGNICPFEGDLWVFKGSEPQVVFKNNGYNLSDGGKYQMGQKVPLELRVPTGAKAKVQGLTRFYNPVVEYPLELEAEDEGGFDVYSTNVSSSSMSRPQFVVQKEGYVTYADVFDPGVGEITIGLEDMEGDPHSQEKQNRDNSIIYNGDSSKEINLNKGESFSIWTSRAWQAIDTITSNIYQEPDKHYYVLSGNDVVSVDDKGIVRAKKEGTAVVAVTYDALNYHGIKYSAIRSDRIATYVFNVGGNKDFKTGIKDVTDLDTFYYAKEMTIDGKSEPIKNDHTTYTFKPSNNGSAQTQVRVATAKGYPTPKLSEWKDYSIAKDGNCTIDLYEGRNIVEVSSGSEKAYYVLSCSPVDVKITNLSDPGKSPKQGEKLNIKFDGVMTPLPKLGAIYNPGFGGTVYLEGKLSPKGNSEKSEEIKGKTTQYDISKNAEMEVLLKENSDYTLDNVRIHSGAFGSTPSTHYGLTAQSASGNYKGEMAPESAGYYSFLPKLDIETKKDDLSLEADKIVNQFKEIGEVEFTDECKAKIDAARKAYDSASQAVRDKIKAEDLKILTDAEEKYNGLKEKSIEKSIKKKTIDEKEYYVITNSDELEFFAKLVNGDLASKAAAKADANAILEANIEMNGADKKAAEKKQWKKINRFDGILDGNGHTISGLYYSNDTGDSVKAENFAMIEDNYGTVKNLTVKDANFINKGKVTASVRNGKTAGIALENSGTIKNVHFTGFIGASGYAVGIAGTNSKTIEDCTVNANLEIYDGKVNTAAAGLAYDNDGTITRCETSGEFSNVANNDTTNSVAGLVVNNNQTTKSCYSTAYVKGYNEAAGLSITCNGKMTDCFFAGRVQSDKNEAIMTCDNKQYGPKNYYVAEEDNEKTTSERFSLEDVKAGKLTFVLGEDFVQELGKDQFPKFATKDNKKFRVFKVEDHYVNVSPEIADKLIANIGEVSLTSDDYSWAEKIDLARVCFDLLSEEDQAKVKGSADLKNKEASYKAIVDKLKADIEGLKGTNEFVQLKKNLADVKDQYISYVKHGADVKKLGDLSGITEAAARYEELNITETAKTIKKDKDGVYQISSADELFYFADLAKKNENVKAVQTKDIVINDQLLSTLSVDDNGYINSDMKVAIRPWNTIESFKGEFNGDGHKILGLYVDNKNENSTNAFFGKLEGAVISGLNLRDSYFADNRAVQGAPVAQFVNAGSTIAKTSVEDCYVVSQRDAYGFAAYLNNSLIKDCYSTAKMISRKPNFGQSFAAGLVGQLASGGKIENCYANMDMPNCNVKGGIAGISFNKDVSIENSYFLKGMAGVALGQNGGNATINGKSATSEQFASGEITVALGESFGQKLGSDSTPVFRTKDNVVVKEDDTYKNVKVKSEDAKAVEEKIAAIGEVGLDGSENCFGKVKDARSALNKLEEADKAEVSAESVAALETKETEYKKVVKSLEEKLGSILPITKEDKTTKFDAFNEDVKKFTDRGGDTNEIKDYATKIAEIKKAIEDAKEDWALEEIGNTIKTKEIEGQKYYVITNAAELKYYQALVNGKLGSEKNANAILGNDITLNENLINKVVDGIQFKKEEADKLSNLSEPIYLQGTFDGDGHSISGLLTKDCSLFDPSSADAVIKNLNVKDSVVTNSGDNYLQYLGGIASRAQNAGRNVKIENCSFQGDIFAKYKNGGATGGIIGATVPQTKVEKSSFNGRIILSGNVKNGTGGIVGQNLGEITKCAADKVEIIYADESGSNAVCFGGIAGQHLGEKAVIDNCLAKGSIKGNAESHSLGGLVGTTFGMRLSGETTKNSYAAVTVSDGIRRVGALIGDKRGNVENLYYLEGAKKAFGERVDVGSEDGPGATAKTAAEFKDGSVTKALGTGFVQSGDYPAINKKDVNPQIKVVEEKIAAIGEVTLEKEAAIAEAREAFNNLPEEDQNLVANADVFVKAEKVLKALKADKAAADKVIKQIQEIGTASLENEDKIAAARQAYNALTDKQKEAVTNIDDLVKAEKALKVIKDDKAAAQKVDKQIKAIGTVNLEKEQQVKDARSAYEALTESQKNLVENLSTLEGYEKQLVKLKETQAKIDKLIADIDNLGEITLDSEARVKELRKDYNRLRYRDRQKVTNYKKLRDAEKKIVELKKQAEEDNTPIDDPITVFFTMSNDNNLETTKDGQLAVRLPVEVQYFNLSDYNLGHFAKKDENGKVIKKPTLLHAYIKFLEKYYNNGEKIKVPSDMLTVSGSAKHSYMEKFNGHNYNLLYYVNGRFPVMEVTASGETIGATSDWIIVSDEDVIDVELNSDLNFYKSNMFTNFTNPEVTAKSGEAFNLELIGNNKDFTDKKMADAKLKYTADGGKTWVDIDGQTDESGKISVKFDKPGDYLVVNSTAGGGYKYFGVAICKVHVEQTVADKAKLEAELAKAKTLDDAEKYTAETLATLKTAIAKAEALVADENATQEAVDQAKAALTTAIEGLKEIPAPVVVDKAKLEAELAKAKALDDAEKYTAETLATLKTAIAKAEALVVDENATQEAVDQAKAALTTAIEGIKEKPAPVVVDKTKLEAAVADKAEVEKTVKYKKATEAKKEAYDNAVAAAQAVLAKEDATQEEVDQAKAAIGTAKAALDGTEAEDNEPTNPDATEVNKWHKDNAGKWSYVGADGKLIKGKTAKINGNTYDFDENGVMTTGWKYDKGIWYYFNEKGNGTEGAMAHNQWKTVNGNWYYFHEDGKMASNEMVDNGKYYVNKSGAWRTNKWVKTSAGKYWYYYKEGNYPKNETVYINGNKYHFDNGGWMTTGWLKDNGTWYYFNEKGNGTEGAMAHNQWKKVGNNWYYFYKDGKMASDTMVGKYYVNKSGAWRTDKWVKTSSGKYWYYYKEGNYPKNETVYINGNHYHFDKGGYMTTGWLKENGTWYYFNKKGEGTEGAMVKSSWKKVNGKWYYFYGDGKMAKNTTISGWKVNSSGAWVK